MGAVTIQQMAQRVAALLDERMKVRGNGLEAKLRRSGRTLPRRVRLAGQRLAVASAKSQVPKLLLQVNEGDVAKDYDICVRHLSAINPLPWPLAGLLRVGSSVALGLLVLAVGAYLWTNAG